MCAQTFTAIHLVVKGDISLWTKKVNFMALKGKNEDSSGGHLYKISKQFIKIVKKNFGLHLPKKCSHTEPNLSHITPKQDINTKGYLSFIFLIIVLVNLWRLSLSAWHFPYRDFSCFTSLLINLPSAAITPCSKSLHSTPLL